MNDRCTVKIEYPETALLLEQGTWRERARIFVNSDVRGSG